MDPQKDTIIGTVKLLFITFVLTLFVVAGYANDASMTFGLFFEDFSGLAELGTEGLPRTKVRRDIPNLELRL